MTTMTNKTKETTTIGTKFIESVLKGSLSPSELKEEEVMSKVEIFLKAAEDLSSKVYGGAS
jgi:hypothetical protein